MIMILNLYIYVVLKQIIMDKNQNMEDTLDMLPI